MQIGKSSEKILKKMKKQLSNDNAMIKTIYQIFSVSFDYYFII